MNLLWVLAALVLVSLAIDPSPDIWDRWVTGALLWNSGVIVWVDAYAGRGWSKW